MFFKKHQAKSTGSRFSIAEPAVQRGSHTAVDEIDRNDVRHPAGASVFADDLEDVPEDDDLPDDDTFDAEDAASVEVHQLSQLGYPTGRPATGEMVAGWCAFGPSQGGRSVVALPAQEGDVFLATADVMLIKPNTNSHRSGFFFGPLFLDQDGNVLRWWNRYYPPAQGLSERISVQVEAPTGTVSVRLGLNGTYDADGNTSDYVIGFAGAHLRKL